VKHSKICRTLSLVIILCLLVIVMPATPALAQTVTVTPTTGPVGTTVTITGTDFTAGDTYSITFAYGNTTFAQTVVSTTTIAGTTFSATFSVPSVPRGTYTIQTATTPGNFSQSFTVTPQITLSPSSGYADDTVTVNGTGFNASSTVTIYFDTINRGTVTATTSGSFSNATFTVPESYRGSHTVKGSDAGGDSPSVSFTTLSKITIAPASGASGDTVTVTGTGFRASKPITIRYNAVPVTTSPATISTGTNGSFTASFNVPAGLAGTYSVEATDGTYSASADFMAAADVTISQTTTEASPGHVGMELTITGTGFIPNTTVTITYTTEPFVTTTTTDANGAFSVTITIPPSTGGSHTIVVTDGYTTREFTFVMESEAPPIPAPLLPEEGTKAKAEAYFDWEDADDPSGVTYTLQIASDEDFTTIVLEKEGLTSSEYTLTEEEKLESVGKKEPYYCRVKAIDGASNESQWSTPRSFYVGFQWPELKGWLLYTLIGLSALLLGIFGFWLGRKTAYF